MMGGRRQRSSEDNKEEKEYKTKRSKTLNVAKTPEDKRFIELIGDFK